MSWFDQGQYQVRVEWGISGGTHLDQTTYAVVVDTLSFSTTVTAALDHGVEVLPFPIGKDAEEFAAQHDAVISQPRDKATLTGGPSLSPASMATLEPGTRIVMPSNNGSRLAYELHSKGATVMIGCLRNRAVLGAWLAERLLADPSASVLLVCAGEAWDDGAMRPALEDQLAAGAIVSALETAGCKSSPEAYAACAVFRDAAPYMPKTLFECSSGRELIELGFAQDVECAAELDVSQSVPVLVGDAFTSQR